jgi:hypothetical protein
VLTIMQCMERVQLGRTLSFIILGMFYDKSTAIQSNDGQTQRGYDPATTQGVGYSPKGERNG